MRKVVSGRITAMAFHPSSEKTIICAGDEYGNIGFWNVVSGGICRDFYRPHTGMDPLRSAMGGGGGGGAHHPLAWSQFGPV